MLRFERDPFEWHDEKSAKTMKVRKLAFDEAETVFRDPNAIQSDDPDHSMYEDRFILIGRSTFDKILTIAACYRHDDVIRIISVRKADVHERRKYERGGR